MRTAAAYIRVSTDDQIEFSPDSQIKAIRKYAQEHDMTLSDEFIYADEGISGRKAEKRPAFQQMIGTAKLRPKPFDVILLWKFSRFARNREDSIVYKSMLRKQCGIDVISVSEQLSEDKTSILIEALIEAMDEYYSLNLAEEVRRGMTEKFSRGGVVSQPPFGYRMGDGIFVPDKEKSDFVRMIFSDFLSGMGARQIAQKLNEMGIRTNKGNKFENRTVEYILTNPVYIGKLRRSRNGRDNHDRFHQSADNTIIVDGKHESVISSEIFEQAQKRLSQSKKSFPRYARQVSADFMLKGLVRCDNCGAVLVMQSAAKSLQCHKYAKGVCRESHSITLEKINGIVIGKLKSDFADGLFDVKISDMQKNYYIDNKAITAAVTREEKKLFRIKEAYEAGVDTLDEYKKNKAEIKTAINKLNGKIQHKSDTENPKERLNIELKSSFEVLESDKISESLKNIILRSFVEKIIFNKPKRTIEIYYKI